MRFLLTFFFFFFCCCSHLVVLQTIEMKTKERPEKKKNCSITHPIRDIKNNCELNLLLVKIIKYSTNFVFMENFN